MTLDRNFARQLKAEANGDGSREAKFVFKHKVEEVRKVLSTPDVMTNFSDSFKLHGRVPVAICLAATLIERQDRVNRSSYDWAQEVMKLYKNAPSDKTFACIDDNLNPSRIEEYAGSFIRVTTEVSA